MTEKFIKENIIRLVNRNELTISGVSKVTAFSPTQITLFALECEITILGEQLQTTKLDEQNGDLCVLGLINCIKWNEKKEKVGIIKRIFK
ncbi:MAG: sporulation protein YabP [Clostridia bacterium]|nr:sporulation protein YabP [Clostridia bacterium]